MRSFHARLKRMERKMLDPSKCTCGGPWRARIWMGDGPEPVPCPKCGSMGKIIHLVRGKRPDADEVEPSFDPT